MVRPGSGQSTLSFQLEMTPLAKGGSVKKKKKFPDMSGDGKVTMKDVLMARGVIKKKNGKKTKKPTIKKRVKV